jgi:hypothetical protein
MRNRLRRTIEQLPLLVLDRQVSAVQPPQVIFTQERWRAGTGNTPTGAKADRTARLR